MDDVLMRIKRAVFAGRYALTGKAEMELDADGLDESDVAESILNASRIEKTIRSTSQQRERHREYLHVIRSPNFSGITIYTKGKLRQVNGEDVYYIMISAKRSR
ncbi:MAG TPA: hypothetical protein VHD56_07330 [Tepidisphaeraceae bacterium]|nr:hypothetical protein [Tepidisphaeraceae bacterium]